MHPYEQWKAAARKRLKGVAMSKDNVFPIRPRPTPEHVSTDEFASNLWDYAVKLMHTEARQLLNAETIFSDKPDRVGEKLERIAETELEAYVDCNGNLCFREQGEGERVRQENRQREYSQRQRHLEHVRSELEALRLDEIDPEWRNRFSTQDTAAAHYWQELAEYVNWDGQPKRVLGKPRE